MSVTTGSDRCPKCGSQDLQQDLWGLTISYCNVCTCTWNWSTGEIWGASVSPKKKGKGKKK